MLLKFLSHSDELQAITVAQGLKHAAREDILYGPRCVLGSLK